MTTHIGFRGLTDIPRPSPDLVQRLAAYAPPDLSDAMESGYTLDARVRPLYPTVRRFAGPAVTVATPRGAFNIIKFAMEQTRAGDVLVINAFGIEAFAVWGSNVTRGMRQRGLAGVVVDGAARDPEEIQELDFPVFARALASTSPPLEGPGEVNVPVACGGVVVRPGDIIVADINGIVAVPLEGAEWVLERVAELKKKHEGIRPALDRGEVVNIGPITESLIRQGLSVDGGRRDKVASEMVE